MHPLFIIASCTAIAFAPSTQAAFVPIPLTPDSFNHDIIVERTAPRPLMPATTASMETGFTNTGYSFFEKGYQLDWLATGLPAAGSIINSDMAMDHEYQFAPDYRSNNAVLIDATLSRAELVLSNPAAYASLSFLLSGANDRATVPLACTVHYQDGSAQSATLSCPDWMDNSYSAYSANGRVNVTTFTFANINANIPMLYSADLTLTNPSPVAGVEISYVRGTGHCAVFAISGAAEAGGPFAPIPFTGYNADLVVEASASHPQFLAGITTATMQTGAANSLWTWFERGYVPGMPLSGLPAAGSFLTNAADPDFVFIMAPAYNANNAAVLDVDSPGANLTPIEPMACSALSFLTAACGGTVTNLCAVQHADGTSETNTLVSPDWNDQVAPAAFAAGGRVNVNNRMLDSLNSAQPRLFTAELALANTTSPVTNVALPWTGSGGASRVAVFAMSGSRNLAPPEPPLLSIQPGPDATVLIHSTAPGQLEYTTSLEGTNTHWQTVGSLSGSTTLPVAPGEPARFFRVVPMNSKHQSSTPAIQ